MRKLARYSENAVKEHEDNNRRDSSRNVVNVANLAEDVDGPIDRKETRESRNQIQQGISN